MFAVETLIFINHNLHLYGSKKEGSKEGSKEDCSEEEEEGINNRSSTKQELPIWEFLFFSFLHVTFAADFAVFVVPLSGVQGVRQKMELPRRLVIHRN